MPHAQARPIPDDPWPAHMRRGAFADAWAVSDAALRSRAGVPRWHLPRHLQPVWDGTPLNGRRVLVRCYHGLGDTIQFARYAPLLNAVAAEVTFWAQPALLPLLATVRGIDRLLPLHDGTPEVDYDVDVEVMELPHVFRTTADTLPRDVPYLGKAIVECRMSNVENGPFRHSTIDNQQSLSVGLVWTAGDWDGRRSVPFVDLSPLADVPGVDWHVLQADPFAHGWDGRLGHDASDPDVTALAATMRSLDLVVTVDSMPAHLAGALGVPVWTLLHADPDWRWGDHGDASAWYPTMRLFRQATAGDWSTAIAAVAAAATATATTHSEA